MLKLSAKQIFRYRLKSERYVNEMKDQVATLEYDQQLSYWLDHRKSKHQRVGPRLKFCLK